MHELSIAMSILDIAEAAAERLGAQVVAVHISLGPLSGVVKDALVSAYDLACEGSPLTGSRLVAREMPIRAWCTACNREQRILSAQHLCCPECGAPTPDIRGGRELEVTRLEIANDTDDTVHPHGRGAPAGAQTQ